VQTIEIKPGLIEERNVQPEEAGPLLDALAIGDAARLRGLVTGPELMDWARGAERIPDGPLADIWLSTETALEVGGEDCDGLARVFRAGAELAGLEAAVAVLEEPTDGQWHFVVEYVDPSTGMVRTFDPKDLPVATEFGGILDSLAGLAKKAGPAIAGAALKALTGDVVGAATGLAGAALGAARGKPAAPKPIAPSRPVFRAPVVRGEVLPQQPQLMRGFFYSVGSDGRTYRSQTGKKGTWEPQ
jgi:hypothetical protein